MQISNKKLLLFALLLAIVVSMGLYVYHAYNRKAADLSKSDADVFISASDFVSAYIKDEALANKQYLGKLIEVTGRVLEIDNQQDTTISIFLGDSITSSRISCLMNNNQTEALKKVTTGDWVRIKGICTGYLMDIELNRCLLVK